MEPEIESTIALRAFQDRIILELLHAHGEMDSMDWVRAGFSDHFLFEFGDAWTAIQEAALVEEIGWRRRRRMRLTSAGRQAAAYLHRVSDWPSEQERSMLAETAIGQLSGTVPYGARDARYRIIRLGMFRRTSDVYRYQLTPEGQIEMERLFPNEAFWRKS